jgi:hypothetical protein
MIRQAPSPERRAALVTALCFGVPCCLYAWTAARTVQGGDTGEFGVLGFLGGVAHPPGYPLYSLLVRLAARLPFGAPFFRVSLVSVVCGAAAVAVLQRALYRLTGSLVASAFAALAFAFSREQWLLAGVPEVFSLNALAAAALLWRAHRLATAPAEKIGREAWVLGLVGGLGMTNHLSLIWCAPLLVWPLVAVGRERRGRAVGALVGGGLLGLTPYLLLPVMAHRAGPDAFVWGRVDTAQGFITHLLRREYGTFHLAQSSEATTLHLAPVLAYFGGLPRVYSYVFFLIGLVGVVEAIRRRARWAVPVAVSFGLAGIAFISLFNIEADAYGLAIAERFFVLPDLLFAPFIAAGIAALQGRAVWATRGLVLAGVLGSVGANASDASWRSDSFIERYFTAAVEGTAPSAAIIGQGDTAFSAIRWITKVQRVRPDVRYFDANLLRWGWYDGRFRKLFPDYPASSLEGDHLGAAITAMAKKRPTYSTWWVEARAKTQVRLQFEPDGLLYRSVPPGTAPALPTEQEKKLIAAAALIGDQPAEPIEQQNAVVRLAAATAWMSLAQRFDEADVPQQARQCQARALFWKPETGLGEELHPNVPP